MSNSMTFSEFSRLLGALGFHESRVKGSHHLFRHEPTDTIFLFPIRAKKVSPQRLASVRELVIGRGVTNAKHFDAILDSICGQKV